jgi:protein involved in polysaccharide export with SLBB domain
LNNQLTQRLRYAAIFALLIVAFSIAPRVATAQTSDTNAAPQTSSAIVPIGPSDPLNVSVIGEPDLTNTYIVDADGNINLPFVGKVAVGGLTPDDAATLIQKKLSQIYTSPQVTVTRTAIGGITVTVIGEVAHQGNQAVRRDAHLNDVVQIAAPTANADLKHVNITHGLPGQRHTTDTYDLGSFLSAGSVDQNPMLVDGDTIFVTKNTQSMLSVSVTGEVIHPGRYGVGPNETAFDLIALAGGLTPTADPTATYLQPMGSTTQSPFNYNSAAQNPGNFQLNPLLHDGDEVVVPMATTLPTYSITGAVLKPGQYPVNGNVSLLNAISLAGGTEARAKVKNTTITRITKNGPVVLTVNAGDTKLAASTLVMAGDTIQIPHGNPASAINPLDIFSPLLTIFSIFR